MDRSAAWVRSAGKREISWNAWTTGKKMPKSAFPLTNRRAYQLAGTWTWRTGIFLIAEEEFRILLAYKVDKQEFLAMLGRVDPDGTTVLCRVEHHGSHPGWHVHYQPFRTQQTGVIRSADEKRRPCGKGARFGTQVSQEFKNWAMTIATELFKLKSASQVHGLDL